eukprot:15469211-Alexandrium_andersonii.AAC.1
MLVELASLGHGGPSGEERALRPLRRAVASCAAWLDRDTPWRNIWNGAERGGIMLSVWGGTVLALIGAILLGRTMTTLATT